jgi:hypothetical protein
MPIPTNPKLYAQAKEKILKAYGGRHSAFASGAIVKEYKRLGGKYQDDGKEKNLSRWFKEKWIDINPVLGITDDKAYPLFRPTVKINESTPTLAQQVPIKRLKQLSKLKQKYKSDKNLPDFLPEKTVKGGMIVQSFPSHPDNKLINYSNPFSPQ